MRVGVLLLLASCAAQLAPRSDAAPDGAAQPDASPPCSQPIPSTVCDSLYDAYVAYIEKCGDFPMTINVLDANVYDVFTARAAVIDHYCNNLPTAPGTAPLQSELVACTTRLMQAMPSCGGANPAAVVSACDPRGTLPPGSVCAFHEQCTSGWCIGAGGADFAFGTCGRLLALGESCDPTVTDVCDGDAYCNEIDHICTTYAHEGEPCGGPNVLQCELGVLGCDSTNTCVALGQAGDPCTALCSTCAPACAWGSICSGGMCTLPGQGMSPLPTCGSSCTGGDANVDAGFAPCACAQGYTCGSGEYAPCEAARNVGDPCNTDLNRCGVSTASQGHNPWLECVNGTCQEPAFCK